MIPHDQSIAVCREIVSTVFDKAGQVICIQHRACSGILDQIADLAIAGDLDDLIVFAGNDIGIPLCRTASENDDVYFIRHCGTGHFDQVVDSHAVLRFQIGTTHVDHDRNSIIAVAQYLRALVSDAFSNREIQHTNIAGKLPFGRIR